MKRVLLNKEMGDACEIVICLYRLDPTQWTKTVETMDGAEMRIERGD
jgi:hypothetical protein